MPIIKVKSILPLLLFFFAITAYGKTTVIKGKIEGKLPKTLYYSTPVNGTPGFDMGHTTKPDAKGNFTITIDINEMAIIDFFYDYQPAGSIITDPGNAYTITITETNGKISSVISGKDIEGQKLYNSMVFNHRISLVAQPGDDVTNANTAVALKDVISKKENADINAFKKLLAAKAISNNFYNCIKLERRYLYATIMYYQILSLHNKDRFVEKVDDLHNLDTLWAGIYKKFPVTDKAVIKSPSAFYFLDGYANFKMFQENNFKPLDDSNFTAATKPEMMYKWLDGPNLEYFIAAYLHSYLVEGRKEEVLLTVYDNFKNKYPKSRYIKFIDTEIAPLVAFQNKSTAPTKATIIENYTTVNSFDELVKKFPGQKLYIDVWATWCGPCRDEFQHNNELYKLLKAEGITPVYISIDNDKKDESWKKMINYYGLEGHHVRTNKKFMSDVKTLYNDNGGIAIPWCILVGTDGKINTLHAAHPSNLEELKTQISKL